VAEFMLQKIMGEPSLITAHSHLTLKSVPNSFLLRDRSPPSNHQMATSTLFSRRVM
jgi:hypothetical protein